MQLQVDSERVAQASTRVQGSVGSIRSEVTAMMRHLTDLQSSWKGSASTQFAAVMAQWQNAQTQVERALDAVQGSLASASRTYADAEAAASRLFHTA